MDALFPSDSDVELIHTRDYQVQAFRKSPTQVVLRGAVRDTKPAGLYIGGDAEPLKIHHMIVDLEVSYPELEITAAAVVFETHPHEKCPTIASSYRSLVGLSIARGFTHKVRELFGGPRGCTHTTALLQAMAPVAVQCRWSMRMAEVRDSRAGTGPSVPSPEQRAVAAMANVNTCHIWAEDGEQVHLIATGGKMEIPRFVAERYAKLGRDPQEWMRQMGHAE